jgi:hypothetical protein
MKPTRTAWIVTTVGLGIGIVGAIAGVTLPIIVKTGQSSLSPEAGRAVAWGAGAAMTLLFGAMAAGFGYLFAVHPSQSPRERSFALVSTAWASLFVAAFPWLLFEVRNSDPTVAWSIIGCYLSIRLVKKWQEKQLRIRNEERGGNG